MSDTTYYRDDASATVQIDESERYRLVSNDQRRTAIEVLADRTEPVSLSALAADVADASDHPDQDPEDVEIQLHHVHLPKLERVGLLDYEREDDRIVPSDALTALLS